MKHIDAVRGLHRDILFDPENRYSRTGALELTNCVVEAVEHDFQVHSPMLSLRFYYKPSGLKMDEETSTGIEINLGLEMAQSLIQQINDRWPELVKIVQDQEAEE